MKGRVQEAPESTSMREIRHLSFNHRGSSTAIDALLSLHVLAALVLACPTRHKRDISPIPEALGLQAIASPSRRVH